jgi:hypothetical protein
MRAVSLFSMAFSAMLLAGCGAEPDQQDLRDLTLQSPGVPAVEVASPVELSRPTPEARPAQRPRMSPKPAPAPAPDPVPEASLAAESAMPVPAVAVTEVTAEPAPVEDASVGAGRELAPGKTVTIIPATSGPSSAPEEPSWGPVGPARGVIIGGGRGGDDTCRPRGGGRGIGIAGRIPVGVPRHRLR